MWPMSTNIKDRKFPFAHSAAEAVSFAVNSITFDTSRMEYRVGDTAALPVDNDTIDLIFSNAVLEHVHNIKATVGEFTRVTRTEGIGIHEIDLRDHFFQQTPLRLLQYQDWLWNLMSWYRPGYTNRLRLSDYVDLFENSGLYVQQKLVTKRYTGVLDEVKLSNKFKRYSLDELAVLTFWLTVKKAKK
jgi:SAM-dependent methyltransferase